MSALRKEHGDARAPSQCDRIMAVLADGRPHRMEDIHRRAGFMRLNSRVAELRGRGHNIVCDKTGGVYTYTLLATTPEEATFAAVVSSGVSVPVADGCLPDAGTPDFQLSLAVA